MLKESGILTPLRNALTWGMPEPAAQGSQYVTAVATPVSESQKSEEKRNPVREKMGLLEQKRGGGGYF